MRCVVVAVLLALAGCENGAAVQQAQQAFDTGQAHCLAQIPAVRGNYAARQRCVNAVSMQVAPNTPGLAYYMAASVAVMARADRGEITFEDAQAELERLSYEIRSRTAADEAAARAQQLGAAAQLIQASQPQQQPQYYGPHTITCNRFGVSTTCTGW